MDSIHLEKDRPVKHVGRKELYTQLETRVSYLHDFLDFNSGDIEALTTGSKYIKALIPAVVNIVYKKLLETDITARAFHTRNTADERPLEEFMNEESPQILRRKMFLRWYLTRLCSDPSSMEFWKYLDKVGLMHCGKGRLHALNIEYVHIGVCLGFIQDIFTEALLSHPRLPLQRKIALVRAIGKIIWIQNDLFAKWYVRDGEEYADGNEGDEYEDKEGYVDGKKVIGESSSSHSSDDDGSSVSSSDGPVPSANPSTGAKSAIPIPSVCPFSGHKEINASS
ncbi:hypothetical protein ASPZODRAFT_141259 [Penicilliopsis zonata CBS 506.65]|uniref:Globin-sensor domain-containing protein n=1 Tax=Penicilliopsis zonata CBS 506.65 TaxID=1073090 RepID=A0A1L9SKT9_9EURO|nr:hypothetical protein ASPZODRAFT_141259 [Penicilliopsis zonata CBS 506.65]OJJ47684.1 hypothetical protein ASPZODRAFT_141259 [Penicilliopsis zonata CBS 506.65]